MGMVTNYYRYIFNWVDFGVAVCEMRRERNITQAQLADLTDCSATFICGVEKGHNEGNHELKPLMAIANELGINFPDYFELELDPNSIPF